MKIDPMSEFIKSKVAAFGEVVIVLGSRSQESSSRAQVMRKHRIEGSRLSRHTSLPNAFVFTPIDEWSADDVWEYLFSGPAPWGGDHQALFDLYKGSNAGECPLVIDTSTPSCGNSRFGCWTCTVVTQDRAMDGLIETGHKWMMPLRDFRNKLYNTTLPENKAEFRSNKRRNGTVTFVTVKGKDGEDPTQKQILGPYKMEYRRKFLEELLSLQLMVDRDNPGPEYQLITKSELEAIRLQWRHDPNEPDWEDMVPQIYRKVMGEGAQVDWEVNDDFVFAGGEGTLVADLCDKYGLPSELFMKLVELEMSFEGHSRRSKLQEKLSELLARDWTDHEMVVMRKREQLGSLHGRDMEEKKLHEQYKTLVGMIGDAT
jgi:DNA sulfur modification protein DndC